MTRLILIIFFVFSAFQLKADKKYTRSYSILYTVLEILENSEGDDLIPDITMSSVPKDFKVKLKKYLQENVIDYSPKTEIKLNEDKKLIEISSDLVTMYQIESLFGHYRSINPQIKFRIKLLEIDDNLKLLKTDPLKITSKLIWSLPAKYVKTIFQQDMFTQNGTTVFMKAAGNILEITPSVDPNGSDIEIELRSLLKSSKLFTQDTRFRTVDRGEVILQIQSKDESEGKNLYLVISPTLLDYTLQPIKRFTKKEASEASKILSGKGKLVTRYYTLSVGMSSGGEDQEDNSQLDFKGYFSDLGVEFTEEESIKFVRGAMRLVIRARESTQLKIEKLLNDIGIEIPQNKIVFRILEVDQNLQKSKLAFGDLSVAKGVKVLDSFDLIAISGKTALITESELNDKNFTVALEVNTASLKDDQETEVELMLQYKKHGLNVKLDRSFSLKNGTYKLFELQTKANKTYMAIVYTGKFIPHTDIWLRK